VNDVLRKRGKLEWREEGKGPLLVGRRGRTAGPLSHGGRGGGKPFCDSRKGNSSGGKKRFF